MNINLNLQYFLKAVSFSAKIRNSLLTDVEKFGTDLWKKSAQFGSF